MSETNPEPNNPSTKNTLHHIESSVSDIDVNGDFKDNREIIIERLTEANYQLDIKVNQLRHVVETSVKSIYDSTDENTQSHVLPPEIIAKDKQLKKLMKHVQQQQRKKEELNNLVLAKTLNHDPTPVKNEIRQLNTESKNLQAQAKVLQDEHAILVAKANKYAKSTQFQNKVEVLNQEILAEKLLFKEMNSQRLQRVKELNSNEFVAALEVNEGFRTRVKRNQNSIINSRRAAKKLESIGSTRGTSQSYNGSPGNAQQQQKQQKDKIKLVGNQHSTGVFTHGKSVPRSRPTMFWEPQVLDLKFDYNSYVEKKDTRTNAHKKKVLHWTTRAEKLTIEISELEKKIGQTENQYQKVQSEFTKKEPVYKDIEGLVKLIKLEAKQKQKDKEEDKEKKKKEGEQRRREEYEEIMQNLKAKKLAKEERLRAEKGRFEIEERNRTWAEQQEKMDAQADKANENLVLNETDQINQQRNNQGFNTEPQQNQSMDKETPVISDGPPLVTPLKSMISKKSSHKMNSKGHVSENEGSSESGESFVKADIDDIPDAPPGKVACLVCTVLNDVFAEVCKTCGSEL